MAKLQQKYNFLLILDFEATCDDRNDPDPQEIIELPCIALDTRSGKVLSTFHEYVTPVHHPRLTHFCTQLTGITQAMVDGGRPFPEVWTEFQTWMAANDLRSSGDQANSAFVTCGDWDLKTMLPKQLRVSGIGIDIVRGAEGSFERWVNVKKAYHRCSGTFPKGMMQMLEHAGLGHTGRHHSGIDDCTNIVEIVRHMIEVKGHNFINTSHIPRQ